MANKSTIANVLVNDINLQFCSGEAISIYYEMCITRNTKILIYEEMVKNVKFYHFDLLLSVFVYLHKNSFNSLDLLESLQKILPSAQLHTKGNLKICTESL